MTRMYRTTLYGFIYLIYNMTFQQENMYIPTQAQVDIILLIFHPCFSPQSFQKIEGLFFLFLNFLLFLDI